jgi:Family of unknown function (DUF5906)
MLGYSLAELETAAETIWTDFQKREAEQDRIRAEAANHRAPGSPEELQSTQVRLSAHIAKKLKARADGAEEGSVNCGIQGYARYATGILRGGGMDDSSVPEAVREMLLEAVAGTGRSDISEREILRQTNNGIRQGIEGPPDPSKAWTDLHKSRGSLAEHVRSLGYGIHPQHDKLWNYKTDTKAEMADFQYALGPDYASVLVGMTKDGKDNYEQGSKAWRKNTAEQLPIAGRIWEPSKPTGLIETPDGFFWNSYVDTRIKSVKPPQAYLDAFDTFMAGFIPDREERDFVMDTLAYTRQNPGRRVGYLLEFVSLEKGSGKTGFCERFGRVMGHDKFAPVELNDINGQYNEHLANTLVLLASEPESQAKYECVKLSKNLLKLTTDSTVDVNAKYGRKGKAVPHFLLLLATNNQDSIDHEELEGRAYNVRCAAPFDTRAKNAEYVQAIFEDFTLEEQDAWFAWMLDRREVPCFFRAGLAAPRQEHYKELIEYEAAHELPVLFYEHLISKTTLRSPCSGSEMQSSFAAFRRDLRIPGSPGVLTKQLLHSRLFSKKQVNGRMQWTWKEKDP